MDKLDLQILKIEADNYIDGALGMKMKLEFGKFKYFEGTEEELKKLAIGAANIIPPAEGNFVNVRVIAFQDNEYDELRDYHSDLSEYYETLSVGDESDCPVSDPEVFGWLLTSKDLSKQ